MPSYSDKDTKIAVIYGGLSNEREISLQSGHAVCQSLKKLNIPFYSLDLDGSPLLRHLSKSAYKKALIMMHGGNGEDGHLVAVLNMLKIKHNASPIEASVIAMNKMLSKITWKSYGLPVIPGDWININVLQHKNNLKFPLCVKPSNSGSSNGVVKVSCKSQLFDAYTQALKYGKPMYESWIDGEEYTIGIVGSHVLPSVKIMPNNDFYDYEAKYKNGTKYLCPSDLTTEQEKKLQALSMQASNAINAQGVFRLDFIRCKKTKEFYLLEINISPGMTEHSLLPKAANAYGWSFDDLVKNIIKNIDNE